MMQERAILQLCLCPSTPPTSMSVQSVVDLLNPARSQSRIAHREWMRFTSTVDDEIFIAFLFDHDALITIEDNLRFDCWWPIFLNLEIE